MRQKNYALLRLSFSSLVLAAVLWWALACPSEQANHLRLQTALSGVTQSSVTLESAVPFQWDTAYAFAPGVTREEMGELTGADCSSVPEGAGGRGARLVFLLGGEVVCAASGEPEALGYEVTLPEGTQYRRITYGEETPFSAVRRGSIVTLCPQKAA